MIAVCDSLQGQVQERRPSTQRQTGKDRTQSSSRST